MGWIGPQTGPSACPGVARVDIACGMVLFLLLQGCATHGSHLVPGTGIGQASLGQVQQQPHRQEASANELFPSLGIAGILAGC